MKPDWDKLMKEYAGNADRLVADVDCTAAGKPLCDTKGVQGFPSIKFGDPNDLQDYKGGRDFKALKAKAESLGPTCGPKHPDLCDAAQKKVLDEYMAYSPEKLAAKISKAEKSITDAEADFKTKVDKLQADYKKLTADKEAAIKAVEDAGLKKMKSVRGHRAAAGEEFASLKKSPMAVVFETFRKPIMKVLGMVGLGGAPSVIVAIVVAVAVMIIGIVLMSICAFCGSFDDEPAPAPAPAPAAKAEDSDEKEKEDDESDDEEAEKDPKSKKDE